MSYTVSGSNLITSSARTIDTSKYCNGATLVTRYDTSQAGYDTIPYTVTSTTLTVMGVDKDSGSFTDPTAAVVYDMIFTRQTSGSGLVGTWKMSSRAYHVVSGTLTAAEQQEIQSNIAADIASIAAGNYTELIITADKINVYEHRSATGWADEFINDWNSNQPPDSIIVTKISDNSVSLVGRISGETVTITNSTDHTTYTSSNTAHATHTYYENPTACPNDYYPTWFFAFIMANPKAAKAAAAPDQLIKYGDQDNQKTLPGLRLR
jgi:hypothetical protein